MSERYVAVSAFSPRTRFAIDPARVAVIESAYPGCIEVHLVNYNYDSRRTAPGGAGLIIGGVVDSIHDGAYLRDRCALLAGFDEVFRIAANYDGVVVLRPTGLGLGFRSELFYQHISKARGPLRTVKKNLRLARHYLSQVRARTLSLTGNLPGWEHSQNGPFFLRERTERWQRDTAIPALTLDQARQTVRALVQAHTVKGWKCGEEASFRGTIQAATDNTLAWLCQKGGTSKWLSVECGRPTPPSEEDVRHGDRAPGDYSAEEITKMCTEFAFFNGFSGERCGRCWADSNVFAGGPGWFCGCGHFNVQSFSNFCMPHDRPDYGPKAAVIHAGVRQHRINVGELNPDGSEKKSGPEAVIESAPEAVTESAPQDGQTTWRLSYRGETHEVHLPAGVSCTITDLLKGDGLPSVDQISKATRGGRKVLLNSSLKPTGVLIELE